MGKRLLVIGAHSADFVWRAAGTIALVVLQGGSASVVALSCEERGESGGLWKRKSTRSKGLAQPPEKWSCAPRSL
jgi:4-oxalomesaconate hydratase